ncbi:hypothetical protein [Cohnella boryungensis]|uniref:Uncharacterized protein n=1 Tax=Cohnella boryungensis TaxID=768479 RepID=A0ABV8SG92_9BACL
MEHEHVFEHAWTTVKPSSESHAWSYQKACEACLAAVETRHGPDWKITDLEFEDLGRETKTWGGSPLKPKKWRCTHRVKAHYNIVQRGVSDDSFAATAVAEDQSFF